MKQAKTIDEQIEILKTRGMLFDEGEKKATEYLLDIGYYRLGFYCFPFEKSYPSKSGRTHSYKENTKLSDVVTLYYLDANLRTILTKYINRIEINFRTSIIHYISVRYKDKPTWFADPSIMEREYIAEFDSKVYTPSFKKISVIKKHHINYINDRYAPAWKAMEYFTFGQMLNTFRALKDWQPQKDIATVYNISAINVLDNYMNTILRIRNACAHGDVLFDINLPIAIKQNGPVKGITQQNKHKLCSCLSVIHYMLSKVSENRAQEMNQEIADLFNKQKNNPIIRGLIENSIGHKFS